MTDIESVIKQLSIVLISVLALVLSFQALAWNLIGKDEFLLILGGILAAYGIGIVGFGVYGAGKRTGFSEGFREGFNKGQNNWGYVRSTVRSELSKEAAKNE